MTANESLRDEIAAPQRPSLFERLDRYPDPFFPIIVILAAMTAILLRWTGLDSQSLWMDEGYTLWISRFSPQHIWHVLAGDTSTPLYYILLHNWIRCFGTSEIALRSLSAFFATISIPLVYLLARRILCDRTCVVLAMALYALSFYQVWYAKEARCYALLALLSLGSVYCLLSYLEHTSVIWACGLVICLAGSLYTHNMAFFYLPGLALMWLIYPGAKTTRERVRDAFFVFSLVLLMYLPWLRTLRGQLRMIHSNFWVAVPNGKDLLDSLCVFLGFDPRTGQAIFRDQLHLHVMGLFGYWTWTVVAFVIFVACVLAGLNAARSADRRKFLALLGYSVTPILLVFVYSRILTPIYINRVFIGSAIFLPMVVCASIAFQVGKRKKAFQLVGLIVLFCTAASAVGYLRRARKDDWRGATAYLAKLPGSKRLAVILPDSCQTLVDYYGLQFNSSTEMTGLLTRYDPPDFRPLYKHDDGDGFLTFSSAIDSGTYKEVDVAIGPGAPSNLLPSISQYLLGHCASVETREFYAIDVRRCVLESKPSSDQVEGNIKSRRIQKSEAPKN
jgi:uncharacterized membrane protein